MKADYEIRQETEKDYPQVFKLVEEAFPNVVSYAMLEKILCNLLYLVLLHKTGLSFL